MLLNINEHQLSLKRCHYSYTTMVLSNSSCFQMLTFETLYSRITSLNIIYYFVVVWKNAYKSISGITLWRYELRSIITKWNLYILLINLAHMIFVCLPYKAVTIIHNS